MYCTSFSFIFIFCVLWFVCMSTAALVQNKLYIVLHTFNPLKPNSSNCTLCHADVTYHFQFLTFGHSGAQPWAPECPNVRNWQVAHLWQRDRASSINDFRWGSVWGYYRLRSYFSRHCDTMQFTLTHHTVNKPFLLIGLAAEYRYRRRRRRCANNIAADHQMFITLTGQLSWQRLRRSAVDVYSKAKKIVLWAAL